MLVFDQVAIKRGNRNWLSLISICYINFIMQLNVAISYVWSYLLNLNLGHNVWQIQTHSTTAFKVSDKENMHKTLKLIQVSFTLDCYLSSWFSCCLKSLGLK